jgi:hypothetical protein
MPNLILLIGKRFASLLANRKGKQLPHSVKTISIQSLPGRQFFLTNGDLSEWDSARTSAFTLTSAISLQLKMKSGYSVIPKDRLAPSHVACSQRTQARSMGGKTHFVAYPGPGTPMTRPGEGF